METPRIEEQTIDEVVNKVIDALVADVHFEKTWPAHTAYYQIDLNQFQKKLRQALTQAHQAGIDEAVEKFRQILVELHNNKQSELHGGYDDADFLTAYCFSLQEAMQRLQALQDNK